MEAAATPFPREETTPPVTKIYFGAIRTGHVPRTAGMRDRSNSSKKVGVQRIMRENEGGVKLSGGSRLSAGNFAEKFFDAGDVVGDIHADGIVVGFDDADAVAVFEPAELLELFELFELARRQSEEFEQCFTTKRVKTEVL